MKNKLKRNEIAPFSRNNKMDLPKDKGQTEYQVVSVFSISVVFATLDTKGTANLRDIPNPTPLTPSQPHKAVDCHCFTLITKRPTGRTELTSWSMLRWESTCSKATGTSSASKGQQNAVGEGGNPWRTLHRTQGTQGQIFSCQGL